MKARYANLHGQIDQMTKVMEEKQVQNFLKWEVEFSKKKL